MARYELQMRQHVTRYRRMTIEAPSEEAAKRRAAEIAKGFAYATDEEEAGEWENADKGRVIFDDVSAE